MKKIIQLPDGSEVVSHHLGHGPKRLLLMLGFGYGEKQVATLAKALEKDFTLTMIEPPFHSGKWQKESYTAEDMQLIIHQLIGVAQRDALHVLGHSLGARIWLKTLPLLDIVPVSVTLVAPDGLGGPYTSWLDRLPPVTVRLLVRLLNRPNGLLRIGKFSRKYGMLDAFQHQYMQQQLGDPFSHQRLVGTLRSLPHFRIGKEELEFLQQFPNVSVLLGEHDRVIDRKNIQSAFAPFPNVTVQMTKGGHGLPIKELVAKLANK